MFQVDPAKQFDFDLIRPRAGDRVLTVRDPWAFLLVTGAKPIENRTWPTNYRGLLWIHAAVNFDYPDFDWCRANGIRVPHPDQLPGGIIGQVEVIDCVPVGSLPPNLAGHWSAEGPICWLVRNAVRLPEPVECRGRLGLWRFRGPVV
jgi:hypothetical protein